MQMIATMGVSCLLLGDSAHSYFRGFTKPFPDSPKNPIRVRYFNYVLSATRCVVEKANARLKNKWMRLKFVQTTSVERAHLVIRACIILNNFAIHHDSITDRAAEASDITALHVGRNEAHKCDFISHAIFDD